MQRHGTFDESIEHPCAEPGCNNLAPAGQLRCELHLSGLDEPLEHVPVARPGRDRLWWSPALLSLGSAVLCALTLASRGGQLLPRLPLSPSPAPLVPAGLILIASASSGFLGAIVAFHRRRTRSEMLGSLTLLVASLPLLGLALLDVLLFAAWLVR